jgi:histidine ammonia-lyase
MARAGCADDANLSVILGSRLMCAAQGIEFRAPLTTQPGAEGAWIRSAPRCQLTEDRYMAGDDLRPRPVAGPGDRPLRCAALL